MNFSNKGNNIFGNLNKNEKSNFNFPKSLVNNQSNSLFG